MELVLRPRGEEMTPQVTDNTFKVLLQTGAERSAVVDGSGSG